MTNRLPLLLLSFLVFNIFFSNLLLAEVFLTPPKNFKETGLHVVAAFIKADNKVLFMKYAPHKIHANQWAIPGGKVDSNESLHEAIIREIKEETSLELDFRLLKSVFIQIQGTDFVYHMFEAKIDHIVNDIPLTAEHTELSWWTLEEAIQQNLMIDEAECIRIAYPEIN